GELLQSTGYPVTVPLALLFKIFGYHFTLARLYMLAWLTAAVLAAFLIARKFFDRYLAVFSLLLITTFASFYGSGRTVVGDIPGFLFFLGGLSAWLRYKNRYLAGLLWGVAVVAKPSLFGLIIPAITLVLLLEPRQFFKNISQVAIGMLPAGLVWF